MTWIAGALLGPRCRGSLPPRSPHTAGGSRKEGPRLRLRIEGVLLQTLDSCGLKATIGALATISGKLGTQAKEYIESGELRGLDLSGLPSYAKEAVLVAVAALP